MSIIGWAVFMKIIRAENAGFCFGVKRAMKLASEAASDSAKPVYSLGPIIHNPQQVEFLSKKGVYVVSDLNELNPGDTLIIRSHGASPEILKEAAAKNLVIVDATCPFVVKAQQLAQQLASEGYQVVIVGEGEHPEVIGIMGFAGSNAWVIEKVSDVSALSVKSRVGVIAQTTQSLDNFQEVVSALLERSAELKIFNTICGATIRRQESSIKIAAAADLMLVIGGRNSANTARLAEICKEVCPRTHHIETYGEIDRSWFGDARRVGVTAGASTPDWIINEVINYIDNMN